MSGTSPGVVPVVGSEPITVQARSSIGGPYSAAQYNTSVGAILNASLGLSAATRSSRIGWRTHPNDTASQFGAPFLVTLLQQVAALPMA